MAHFEIFVLNFNGASFLGPCLESLKRLDLEGHTAVVSVVDNCSSDNSKDIVSSFQGVNFISLSRNYGFSKGNNLGVKARLETLKTENIRPDYIVFLNNDTVVDENWLKDAAALFTKSPKIGVVGSKSLFLDKFLEVSFEAREPFNPSSFGSLDTRDLGVSLSHQSSGDNIHLDSARTKWIDCHSAEAGGRWLKPKGRILFAIKDPNSPTKIKLRFDNGHPEIDPVHLRLMIGNKTMEVEVSRSGTDVSLSFEPSSYIDVVQNAGSFVSREFSAGDRGIYEQDSNQFSRQEPVPAVCGVSLFIRAELFQKLKGFDEDFYSYFEDTDLCLRARLAGYECWFSPTSKLRHIHCGSGVEFSDYFNSNVAFSHLLFGSKYMETSLWKKTLSNLLKGAKAELPLLLKDWRLTGKPNLKAYIKYLRKLPIFKLHRFVRFLRSSEIESIRNLNIDLLHTAERPLKA